MTEPLGDTIASQIRHYRLKRRMSVRELGEECARLAPAGVQLTAASLANIERGQVEGAKRRRRDVTAAELLVIAAALRVPPLLLLCPLDGEDRSVEAAPGVWAGSWPVAKWISGEAGFVGYSEQDLREWQANAEPLIRLREHDAAVSRYRGFLARADFHRRFAAQEREAGNAKEVDRLLAAAEMEDNAAREEGGRIIQQRIAMRQKGMTPPPLPPELQSLDMRPEAATDYVTGARIVMDHLANRAGELGRTGEGDKEDDVG